MSVVVTGYRFIWRGVFVKPTQTDVEKLYAFHEEKHGYSGMKKSNSVFQRLRFPSGVSNCYPSKEDQTQKISKSVFVTNFSDHFSARELWNVCVAYGKVVDVFIPFKRSKAATELTPAIVLDDDCLIKREFSCLLMGKIKDLNAILNLDVILSNEGFMNVKISHLGGFGVLLNMDSAEAKEKDSKNMSLSYKRLCVKIKANVTINDIIKVIVNGKPFWIRIKELEPWSLNFNDEKDDNSVSRDESVDNDLENNNDNLMNDFELDNENKIDHVSESSFMNDNDLVYKQASKSPENPSKFADPFNTYSLLKKNKEEVVMEDNMNNVTSDKSDPPFPPVFTPDVGKDIEKEVNSGLGQKAKKGWIQELNSKHRVSFVALQETKMKSIDLFSIKALWGNFAFDYVLSPSIPSATKILIIVVYAPHDLNEKRMLWEFLGHLIDTWDGECVLLGDFNEVQSINERFGTLFNPHRAESFNDFISIAGLVDLPIEGYSYTWAYKSASKMSKLDMFLVGISLYVTTLTELPLVIIVSYTRVSLERDEAFVFLDLVLG
uniref:RNA-directed DNA polymerase, eukaryota n=1 Tax=Tanacetum cinerariifolium TaxID=118510 RepID=A0A699I4J1_TANCI|nr:RNA-directed DNA polymerase, eukaryota [Tanacetum cinerariifolium]